MHFILLLISFLLITIYSDKCFGNTKENDTDQLKKEFEITFI